MTRSKISDLLGFLIIFSIFNNCLADENFPQNRIERNNEAMGSILSNGGLNINSFIKNNSKSTTPPPSSKTVAIDYKLIWQTALEYFSLKTVVCSDYQNGVIETDWYVDTTHDKNVERKIIALIKHAKTLEESIEIKASNRILVKNVKKKKVTDFADHNFENKVFDAIAQAYKSKL